MHTHAGGCMNYLWGWLVGRSAGPLGLTRLIVDKCIVLWKYFGAGTKTPGTFEWQMPHFTLWRQLWKVFKNSALSNLSKCKSVWCIVPFHLENVLSKWSHHFRLLGRMSALPWGIQKLVRSPNVTPSTVLRGHWASRSYHCSAEWKIRWDLRSSDRKKSLRHVPFQPSDQLTENTGPAQRNRRNGGLGVVAQKQQRH